MKSKIFKSDQIPAIQDGRMTQFMQVVKPQPWSLAEEGGAGFAWSEKGRNSNSYKWNTNMVSLGNHMAEESHFGKVGDVIYCREKWNHIINDESEKIGYYHSTDTDLNTTWLSPATMPREAARLFLRITNIRVMRVQELTQDDFIKHGISRMDGFMNELCIWRDSVHGIHATRIKYFKKLIGENVWDTNPYVWCIDFTKQIRHEMPLS